MLLCFLVFIFLKPSLFTQKLFHNIIALTEAMNMYWNKIIPELSVTNLENSLKFYKTIGFKIEYDRPENKFAFISLGEIQFMLQQITSEDN